jgi:hydrogenase maturation factor HypF (carbamoyltransferase family)
VRGALERAVERLKAGGVLAVQGPYGAVAVCRTDKIPALRLAIGDEYVALALLVAQTPSARKTVALSAAETKALTSAQAPELLVTPSRGGVPLARELAVFGSAVRLRLPDSPLMGALAAGAGPLAVAAASRGGAFLPQGEGGQPGLPHVSWLTDGPSPGDPVPPARAYYLGRRRVLLAHGRGSLPATAAAWHDKTVLALGADSELYGAASFGGTAYLSGCAGPSTRAQSADRLRRLVSRAAALSPAAAADQIDAVITGPAEGTPIRLAAEETAESTGCPLVEVSPVLARALAALPAPEGAPVVVVLGPPESAARKDKWLGTPSTGGDAIDPLAKKVVGGLAPFELVESPGGRGDLVGPLASLFERAGAPVLRNPKEDAPLLEVLRTRSHMGTSFVLLVDGVAAALDLVPRRAPTGSGLAEIAGALQDRTHARRFRFHPRLVGTQGSKRADTVALLREWADHWHAAARREGKELPWERRLALGASFLHGLLAAMASSVAQNRRARSPVLLTGAAFATPPVAAAAVERFQAAGLEAAFPADLPILDGALPVGQVRAFARARPTKPKSR